MLALSPWVMGMPVLLDIDRRELVAATGERRPVKSRYRFRALACLYAHTGKVVERDALIRVVYAEEARRLAADFIPADFYGAFHRVMSDVRIDLRGAGYPDDVLVCYPGEGYLLDDRLLQEAV